MKLETVFQQCHLYANELMIRCKEAAVRVSPQVWEAVRSARAEGNESRMLTVKDDSAEK